MVIDRFSKTVSISITALIALVVMQCSTALGIEISAEVDRTFCMVGDRINYDVTVTGSATPPALDPADFDGFDIISGPYTSTSFQSINGVVTQQSSLQYVLRANQIGTYTLGPARLSVNRKTYLSNKITVTVEARSSATSQKSKRKTSTQKKLKSGDLPDVFLVAEADKDTAYRHEMITVSYKLYIKVNVSTPNLVKLPKATGFWVEEFTTPTPSNPDIYKENLDGYNYTVAVIRKVGLFPTRTGELSLEPLIAEVAVEQRSRRSYFRSYNQKVRTVATDPLDLVVLPLPEAGRPAGFKGDVGTYQLDVSYDKRQLDQHDALTMKVTIGGTGYIKSIDAPEIDLPEGFESYEPTVEENISKSSSSGMRGKKTFTYVIIPRISGEYNLKPIQFSFFDPKENRYRTIKDGGTRITVKPSEGITAGIIHNSPTDVTILGSDIRFLKGLEQPLMKVSELPYRKNWFYILLFLPTGLFIAGVGAEKIIEKRFADPVKVRRRKAPEQMRRALKNAHNSTKQNRCADAVTGISQGLSELVGAIIDEPAAGLTSELLDRRLNEHGVPPEMKQEIMDILHYSDRVRFTDGRIEPSETVSLLERSKAVMNKLTKS